MYKKGENTNRFLDSTVYITLVLQAGKELIGGVGLLAAAVVVVLQILGADDVGIVAGHNALDDEPGAVPLLPLVDVAAVGFHGEAGLAGLGSLLAGGGDIGFTGGLGAVLVELDKDVGHHVVGGDHHLVLGFQHGVDIALAAALIGGAVVHHRFLGKNGAAQLVVDAVHSVAIAVQLLFYFFSLNIFFLCSHHFSFPFRPAGLYPRFSVW